MDWGSIQSRYTFWLASHYAYFHGGHDPGNVFADDDRPQTKGIDFRNAITFWIYWLQVACRCFAVLDCYKYVVDAAAVSYGKVRVKAG